MSAHHDNQNVTDEEGAQRVIPPTTPNTIVAPAPSHHAAESADEEMGQYQHEGKAGDKEHSTLMGVGDAQSKTHIYPATPTQNSNHRNQRGNLSIRQIDDLVIGSPLRGALAGTPCPQRSGGRLKRPRNSEGPNKRRLTDHGSLVLRPRGNDADVMAAVEQGSFSTVKEMKMVQAANTRVQLDQQLNVRKSRTINLIGDEEKESIRLELGKYTDPAGVAIGDKVYTNLADYATEMLTYFTPDELLERLKQEYQWYTIYSEHLETIGTFNGLFVQYLSRKKGGEEDALLSFPQWRKRVNDRKNGIIRKMQCRSFMASKWCEEAMEVFCAILNDGDDSNYVWAQTHGLVEMATYQQAKDMLIVCIVNRLNHPMAQRSKSLCPRTIDVKEAKELAPGTRLTDEELAAQGFERDSFGFLKCMGSPSVVPLALHKKYGHRLGPPSPAGYKSSSHAHSTGSAHEEATEEEQVEQEVEREGSAATEEERVEQQVEREGSAATEEGRVEQQVEREGSAATEEGRVEQQVEREGSAATAIVQAEVSEGESQLEEEASADERLGSMERAPGEIEEEEGAEIGPDTEAGPMSPLRETSVEPCPQTSGLSEEEASEHEMDGEQTKQYLVEWERVQTVRMGRPALFERSHFVPAKKQIHLLSSRWYRDILAKAGRTMAMSGESREWRLTGIMDWLKSTIVHSPVGERSLADLHFLEYHLHLHYMREGPVLFTIGQQMAYGDPALYLLEVMARKGTEYRFAAVPTPMRVRGKEENAIIMKGQSGGGPCIIQCPAGELVMAGWLHVLNDKDICTADGTALTLQEVRSMHFYKGRDDTEKAKQLTFVPSVDFGFWKISRGVLGELPWSDVVLVDELEKFLGGNDEDLVEYIKGWQRWCEEEYTKLFAVMWKKEKEWGARDSWCTAIEEAYCEEKKRSVQELIEIVKEGDLELDEV